MIPGTSVPFRIKGRRFGSSLTRAEVPQDADETMASEILSLGGGGRTGRLWENHDSELYSSGYNQQETRVYGDDGANIIGKRRQSAASTRHTTASSVNLRCRGKRGDYTRTSCLAPGTWHITGFVAMGKSIPRHTSQPYLGLNPPTFPQQAENPHKRVTRAGCYQSGGYVR